MPFQIFHIDFDVGFWPKNQHMILGSDILHCNATVLIDKMNKCG